LSKIIVLRESFLILGFASSNVKTVSAVLAPGTTGGIKLTLFKLLK
jgi:hypothetical protein